jgi:tetratricopeptide (TPR) repeat protein/serine/threonine protein kinase
MSAAEAVFFAALAKVDPADRAAYLNEACGNDADLRRQVDRLLAAHPQVGSFLHEDAAAHPSPLGGVGREVRGVATVDAPITESLGTVIGPYKLMQQIGEGGMGSVFMAKQTQPVQRKVALKVIKAGMDSKQVIARFEAERQALALMDHVNIARVFDGGTTANGRPYFVMELVHGVPITKYCDDNHLTPRERLELFVPVCQAIQHAHQKGIIHRDVKPSNVMITLYDGRPVPKVIDFGVAKATEQKLTEQTLFTQYGTMVGTLEYMSPEQAEMSALGVDTRSDIYSLGVLLYELLTGSTPLTHKRMKEAGYAEILRLIKEEEPPRPSTRLSDSGEALASISANRHLEPARLMKLVRGELDWIVMKCLEKDRNRRYETANGLAQDVERYLHDKPVQACPPSAWYHFRKFARRNRGRLAAAAGVFLAVLVMAVSIGWAVRDRAARQVEAERRACEDFEVARTLIAENKLSAARQRLASTRAQLSGEDRLALAGLAAKVEAAEAELDRLQQFRDRIDRARQAEITLRLEPGLGRDDRAATPPLARSADGRALSVPFRLEALDCYAVLERDDWDTALQGGLLGRDQVEQIRRTVYEELLWLAADLGYRQQEHRSGQKLSLEAASRAALVYLGKAERAYRPTHTLYLSRANCRKNLGDEAAAQADRQLADKTPPTLAVDHYVRGMAAYRAKQLAEAIQAFEAALDLEPTHYWSLMRQGYCLCDLGRGPGDFAGAVRIFTGCILNHPDHAHAYACRGLAYIKLGQYDKAVADCSRAVALDPKHVAAWFNRARAYEKLGRYDKAADDSSRAIDLDPKYVQAWYNRGNAYRDLGQHDKAVADFSKAIDLDPEYKQAWNNRGAVYSNHLGQHDKAVADFTQAVALDPKYADAWYNRGVAHNKLDQYAKAAADFTRVIDLDPKHADAWHSRGVAYGSLNQYDKAAADFTQAIELDPRLASAWYDRGLACIGLGQYDKAAADFSRAIDLNPKHADAWYNRGFVHGEHLGQHPKAIADFTQAIELNPKLVKAWFGRGLASHNLGQYAEAVDDYSRAIDLDPKYANAWFNRGLVYDRLSQYDKAVADFTQAIELDPQFARPVYNRGIAYARLGQYDKATDDYETFLKLAPTNAGVHNSLAWLLATSPNAKRLDPDRAVRLARKAVQLAPKAGTYWRTLGVAHYRAGDWKAAVAALDKSVELRGGMDASDRLFLAMAYRKLGKHDESREAYNQALQWLEKNEKTLRAVPAEELRRFRNEAEEVLELKKK